MTIRRPLLGQGSRTSIRVEPQNTIHWLICEKCGLRYPIRDGIPVMLIHEATLPAGVKDVKELPCQKEEEKA